MGYQQNIALKYHCRNRATQPTSAPPAATFTLTITNAGSRVGLGEESPASVRGR